MIKKNLYRHLEDHGKTDELLHRCYHAAIQILPFIHRGIRNFTSHGIKHSEGVIRVLNRIIDILQSGGQKLSQTEVRLLYMAAWLHDIGNLKKDCRERHSLESCELIDKLDGKYIDFGDYRNSLKFIVMYHSQTYVDENGTEHELDIGNIPNESFEIDGDPIRLQLLCSIFRLADACHIGKDRANGMVYYLIKEELDAKERKHWNANKAIIDFSFKPKEGCIKITAKNRTGGNFIKRRVSKELKSVIDYLGDEFPCKEVKLYVEPNVEDYK